jgi:hypothetical protein
LSRDLHIDGHCSKKTVNICVAVEIPFDQFTDRFSMSNRLWGGLCSLSIEDPWDVMTSKVLHNVMDVVINLYRCTVERVLDVAESSLSVQKMSIDVHLERPLINLNRF